MAIDPMRHKMESAMATLSEKEKKYLQEVKTDLWNSMLTKNMVYALCYLLLTEG